MPVDFLTDFEPGYGEVADVTPMIRRVVCDNPGRFTFTGTGTYIVGRGQVAVVDPGPDDDEHVAAVLAAVAGEEVTHILVTHTHRDHSPGARALQTATGAVTFGFGTHPVPPADEQQRAKPTTWKTLEPTEEELEELRRSRPRRAATSHSDQDEPGDMGFSPDVELGHGDVVAGGTWTIEAVHTPGHISNHLCYCLREEQSLFTGDHVMGWSTSVVPSPEGSMSDYLASLALLLDRDDRVYYPTHGPPIPHPREFTLSLIDHRLDRERQILDCLATGPKTIPDMVTTMYQATPHVLHMAAGQSVYSHLVRMHEAGKVDTDATLPTADSTYRATP
jgi:glyoxylase-like metal-dependent hydrolase (beta-lactamase superfamily II)